MAKSEDTFDCHNLEGSWGAATSIWWAETGALLTIVQCTGQPPQHRIIQPNTVLFCLFRTAATAHGGSQARRQIGATAAGLRHTNMGSEPRLWPTAHGNTGPLTHWVRPGIEPTSSWIPVVLTTEPLWELPAQHSNSAKLEKTCFKVA